MAPEKYDFKMIINDTEVNSASNKRIEVLNPANWEIIGSVPLANKDDVEKAINSANRSFEKWKTISPDERSKRMLKAAEIIEGRIDEIAKILTLEQGKPIEEAKGEVKTFASVIRFYSEEAKRIEGYVLQGGNISLRSIVVKEPIGVTAVIGPWNYPLALLALKIGPALAAGCTVIVKPPTETPLAAIYTVKNIIETKCFPEGTLNIITGKGSEIGNLLTSNKLINKISFTGSTKVGKSLMRESAEDLKKLSLELGGNSPFIVWKDADIHSAVCDGVKRAFKNAGQICNSINRIYVHYKLYDKYVKEFVKETKKLKVGNGLKEDTDIGPMATKEGVEGIINQINDAVGKGAKVLYGGKKPEGKEFDKGYFIEPTVLIDVDHNMLVMKEESFGPIVPIMPVKEFKQVISLANDTKYGLVSYAYTKDLNTAYKFSEKLKTGTVCINNISSTNLKAPYGGIKDSGFGRECGRFAIEEYLTMKHICLKVEEVK